MWDILLLWNTDTKYIGDSGGPLVTSGSGNGVTPGQNYELIGVTSWGKGNQCGLVTVYAR